MASCSSQATSTRKPWRSTAKSASCTSCALTA
jgi:hypothetical protein